MPADGILRAAGGFAYVVTPDDAIWLARAAKYEGRGDARHTVWSLAQRFVEVGGPGTRYATLKALVRAYAQPVNPIWMRDGSMCRPGGTWYNRCNESNYCPCEERRLQVRDRAAIDPAPETMPVVQAWLRGELTNTVPRGSEYAAPWLVRNKLESGDLVRTVLESENWYATTRATEAWGRSYVTISGVGEGASVGRFLGAVALATAAVAVGAALGAGGVWSFAPRRRRRR